MSKKIIHRDFTFTYPLKHKVVRDLRIVTEHIGDLTIECSGKFCPHTSPINIYERYNVDIHEIRWNGTDIKPVLVVMGEIADIEESAMKYFAKLVDTEHSFLKASA